MTPRYLYATRLLAIGLLAAGGGCDTRTLVVSSDAAAKTAAKTKDGSSSVDVAPKSQPAAIDGGGGQCPDGYAPCGKRDGLRCYDLSRSQDHCGVCGNACALGIGCQAGTCQQNVCKGALSFKTLVFGSTGIVTALGDFDGDGILDLVGTSDSPGPMGLLWGTGNGTFVTGPVIEPLPDSPDSSVYSFPYSYGWQALAADLDGDGLQDLVSIGESVVKVRLGLGNRENPFGEATSYPVTSSVQSGLLLADFDADGMLDLVVSSSKGLEYWRGQGSGRFGQHVTLNSSETTVLDQVQPGIPQVFDWNGDGALDLVYSDFGYGRNGFLELGAGGNLLYRLGHGDGTFDSEVACPLTWGIVGDLDHDHRPDLISSSSGMGATLSLGINGCGASKVVPITDWTKQGGVALADFNGDGNLDVVIDDNLAIMVHVGDGKGGFPHALTLPAPTPNGQWPLGNFLVGDLNGDGKLDIVFARDGGWGVLLNTCQ
jgi:hypothetical protein